MKTYGSIKVFSSHEFAQLSLTVPWLVEGLVPAYGIGMLYADAKVGKSILSVQLCHALANNLPFLDCTTTRRWKVLYVQADEPAQEWIHQLHTLGINSNWDTVHLPPGALTLPRVVTDLRSACANYEFIVFDALVSLFGYPDIRSSTTMGYLLGTLRSLYDGPCWVIHHKAKGLIGIPRSSVTSAAGSFALGAGVSVLYDLTPTRLTVLGRVISAKLNLIRLPNGLWALDQRTRLA